MVVAERRLGRRVPHLARDGDGPERLRLCHRGLVAVAGGAGRRGPADDALASAVAAAAAEEEADTDAESEDEEGDGGDNARDGTFVAKEAVSRKDEMCVVKREEYRIYSPAVC